MPTLHLTDNAAADALLSDNMLALLIGMLLDQQVPMEWAFSSPITLQERLGEPLTAQAIAGRSEDDVEALFRETPALHRYPGSMGKRAHALCVELVTEWDGRAEALWEDEPTGKELLARLQSLPGYGKQKAQIFLALIAKQCGVAPEGWEKASGDYALEGHRSIADVTGPDALLKVRAFKQETKAAAKAAKAAKPKK